ncbi:MULTISPECIES: LysM peptidoglycan-binding domain-containing protein [unclassified Virgibacillus]|uniref:LysM peptidoglycan-binding domain-containing protein n=1 Tax=unclassified Virgibacillus TaxID=2620237 RepID=UPI00090C5413|nr:MULTISPECIES: LysM peptidoglycan-binding domain-containing protein [unclassified Virgibacillus]API91909.1 cell wall-binding protein [Virgibacillus sp. 6R]MBS7430359.1 LysM peptidoglycan-binding domain-containing protein [Virgibacillus sp. 19R1-5]
MKKIVASFATGMIIAGTAATTVSAEEYDVKNGDNLWNIANEYNTTVEHLVEVNELKTTTIQPKQTLIINKQAKMKYKVQKGDTLSVIANKYGVSVENLKEWNKLDSDLIIVGQNLTIEGATVSNDKPAETEEQPQAQPAVPTKKEQQPVTETKAPVQEQQATPASSKPAASQKAPEKASEQQSQQENPQGQSFSVTATAYTASCNGCSGVTATGVDLNKDPNAKVIAVDPSVIPLGSKVYVEGYGYATAADTGGAIKGNKIDVHVPSKGEATNWGVRTVNVTIVE